MSVVYKRTVVTKLPDKEYLETAIGERLNIKQLPMLYGSPTLGSHQQKQQEREREQEFMQTIEKVLNAGNLTQSCYEVVRNDGAGGVDNMSVKELKDYLDKNRKGLTELIRNGSYYPNPIR